MATPTTWLSYGELAGRVRDLTGQFAANGIGRGDRVLLALPNTPATVVAALAVHSLGATTVEVNRQWGADVLSEIVSHTYLVPATIRFLDALPRNPAGKLLRAALAADAIHV